MPMPVRILRRLNSRDRFTEEIIYIYIEYCIEFRFEEEGIDPRGRREEALYDFVRGES